MELSIPGGRRHNGFKKKENFGQILWIENPSLQFRLALLHYVTLTFYICEREAAMLLQQRGRGARMERILVTHLLHTLPTPILANRRDLFDLILCIFSRMIGMIQALYSVLSSPSIKIFTYFDPALLRIDENIEVLLTRLITSLNCSART